MTEPTPDETVPDDTSVDEVDDSTLDPRARDALRKARNEARNLRTRLRESESTHESDLARLAAHERSVIEQAVKAAGFYDASDFLALHPDTSDFVDEFHEVVPDRVAEAAKAILDAKPYLGRPVGPPPTDRPIEGLRSGALPPEDKPAKPRGRAQSAAQAHRLGPAPPRVAWSDFHTRRRTNLLGEVHAEP